jgi:DNA-binding SARP family transcriptional activator
MEFRILGPLEALDEGRPIPLDRRLSRALLAYLLLHANEPVSSERLLDQLWGETPPKTAVASLQNYVSRLRKSIGHERLRLEPAGYVLRVDPERFDLARFDRLVSEAQTAPAPQRAELLRAAISLWRGEPLEDLAFEEFAQAEIAHLTERLLGAIESRIDADLELGGGAELVGELEGLVAAHPLRERLRSQLMLALYRSGRQADALEAYREARRMLRDELGLDPTEELRALERRILDQDPTLFAAGPEAVAVESRRTVTVLFCDVVDSTRLATSLDPEAYRHLMSSYYDAAKRAMESHGGVVEKFIGDAVMAVFGVPELHEDDPLRAVRAAVDVRAAIDRLAIEPPLRVRIAVNTGEVVTSVESDRPRVTGAAINIAAHLEKHAETNEIVLGAKTHALVHDAVSAESVDFGEGLSGFRLVDIRADANPSRRFDARLVGRKRELRTLRAALQSSTRERACGVVTVVGEAGIGKTRLAREFVRSAHEESRVLVGRCVAYGAGATYLPVAEIVQAVVPEASAAGIRSLLAGEDDVDQVAQRLAEVAGLVDGPAAPGESFWAIRRLFEALARERPLVVVFDDLQWAEQTLLDLVEYLGEWADGPILILCLARRELLESRQAWGGPTSTSSVVELEPLGPDDVTVLLDELAGGPVAPDVRQRIVERGGGNPLFAEQLLALAAEAPEVSPEETPPTVEALIASRLDRLVARERELLRRASVIGRLFTRVELADLGPIEDSDLRSLERRALIHPMQAKGRFRFHHVLVRDVAYHGIPKAERAELHEQVAQNLDRRNGADEIIGYHLEQAYLYRESIARGDDHARTLATAAGDRFGRAGIRAWKRADAPAATNLMGRAAALLPEAGLIRDDLLCELAIALRAAGQWKQANDTLERAIRVAKRAHDRRAELRAMLELAHNRTHHETRDNPAAVAELVDLATTAIPTFEASGDERSLGRAWLLLGSTEGNFRLRFAALEAAAERAAKHYRSAGWSPSSCLSALMNALYYGPRPARDAIAYSHRLLQAHAGDQASEANVFQWLGGLEAMRGEFDVARAHVSRAKALYEGLGLQFAASDGCALVLADVETLAGRIDIAAGHLQDACEVCLRQDESALLASRAAQCADALYTLGHYEEADEWAQVSRDRADRHDLHASASWRGIASRLAARRGELELAGRLIDEARAMMAPSDAVIPIAKLELESAEVYRFARRGDDARRAIERAVALYRAKGNVVAAGSAQSLLRPSAVV